MKKKLILVDGTAQLYRAFYGIKPLTDSQGRPVNAVYGFAMSLLNLMEKYSPTHMVVMFDRPEPTHRHKVYPEYKAKREAAPDDLKSQISIVKELVQAFQIPICEKAGFEADDLIGTVANKATQEKFETLIFSNDKDLFQLVGKSVHMLRPVRGGKGEYEELDPAGVERVFGVRPDQVVDMLSLMGDASDNIPGVPGVGEKTALDLITTYGSLDNLYKSLDKIPKAKLKEKLEINHQAAQKARDLILIPLDVPTELEWDMCQVAAPLPNTAYSFMADLGFKRLLMNQPVAITQPVASWAQSLIATEDLQALIQQAQEQKKIAIEVSSKGIALAAQPREALWLSLEGTDLVSLLRQGGGWVALLSDPEIVKVGYDIKPLVVAACYAGLKWQGPIEDLHLAAHLLDLPSNRPIDFVTRVLGGPPPEEHPEYISCALLLIATSLHSKLESVEAQKIYSELELPLLPILAEMESRGIALDSKTLNVMSKKLGKETADLEAEIQKMAGVEFNVRSPQQLSEVLFERLGLTAGKKTKTGRSTSVDVLETLAAEHPLPQKILEFRQLQKLKSTYVDVLPTLVHPEDQRIHTTFHQVGAVTGRLSSSDPNLQNIPIRTERGRLLRQMFVAADSERALLSADYSQIELRLLAHLSEDEQMLADFAEGLDIHTATASDIFQVSVADVTPEMRRQAKTCNFGIAYGVSPFGLARQLRIANYQAKEFIDGFFGRYPQVRNYLDSILESARELGYVQTFLGRRRYLPDIQAANRNIREGAERMAINTPIQGSAADVIKKAMLEIDEAMNDTTWTSRMLLQVHDELVFEGPKTEMPALQELVVRIMSQVYTFKAELKVEAAWGNNWMEAHA
jgi:DNA polymerase I